jgi:hypothetical protein
MEFDVFPYKTFVLLAWVACKAMLWKSYFTEGCKWMSASNLQISWTSWINFFIEGLQINSVITKFVKIGSAKAVLYLSGLYEIFPVHSALLALTGWNLVQNMSIKTYFVILSFYLVFGPMKATIHLQVYINLYSYFTHLLSSLGEFRYKGSENNAADDLWVLWKSARGGPLFFFGA